MPAPLDRRTLIRRGAEAALAAGLVPWLAEQRGRLPLGELRDAVRGQVLAPGQAGYDVARRVYNRRYDRVRPPAVVRVRSARDVEQVVRWAGRHDVRLVVRSGGHAYNGASTSDDAVVVDVERLRGIALNGDGIATVGPGAENIDVYAALARRGATVPSGSCPTVAVGGLVTGGGMGLAGRRLGLLCDRVTGFDVVTADGRLRHVDARTDADLFWALRGGGGSFGIVTAVRMRVHRVRRAAWFMTSFPRGSAEEALDAWDDLAPGAPAALTSIFTLPGGDGRVTALGQYLGSEAALRRLVAPLSRVPGARMSTGTSGYLALMRRWAGCADGGLAACHRSTRSSFAGSSLYVSRRLSPGARRAFVAASRTGATLILDSYGGVIDGVAPGATAFVHRNARFSVQIISYAAGAAGQVRRARQSVSRYGDGQAYQNYADPALSGALRAYYGDNLPRLRRIKAAVDPENRFRPTQGIRPAA
jgi:FAD/FMN-containing dehydrogenase